MSTVLAATLSQPELRAGAADGMSGELPALVEEVLRWEPPVTGVVRVAADDTELDRAEGGPRVPGGTAVLADLRAANHDRSVFPHPDHVDLGNIGAARHVAFGWGAHRCLGMHLARAELTEGVAAIAAVMPRARVVDAGVVEGHLVRSVPRLVVSPSGG
jgi:cytochrome P450